MGPEAYIFFTKCHLLYVQGMRRSIKNRLVTAYGEQWWDRGVLRALPEAIRDRLAREVERYPDAERHDLLDVAHFGQIIASRHANAFTDDFADPVQAYRSFRRLASVRNRWAHIQTMSHAEVRFAAELMRQILAALRCEEALEIAEMTEQIAAPDVDYIDEHFESEQETVVDQLDHQTPTDLIWQLWNRAQSFLEVEQEIYFSQEIRNRTERAHINLKVHNNAPNSLAWPVVHFRSVQVGIPQVGTETLEALGPGETREIELSCPAAKLVEVQIEVSGQLDSNRLFDFWRTAELPEGVVIPIRQKFTSELDAVQVRDFVANALQTIDTVNPDMTLSEIANFRTAATNLSQESQTKLELLGNLFGRFHLSEESNLGNQLLELIRMLQDFGSKISILDDAIGHTDLDEIRNAVQDLKQMQLAVFRIEDAIRTTATTYQSTVPD